MNNNRYSKNMQPPSFSETSQLAEQTLTATIDVFRLAMAHEKTYKKYLFQSSISNDIHLQTFRTRSTHGRDDKCA
jgi:hypothetical protein